MLDSQRCPLLPFRDILCNHEDSMRKISSHVVFPTLVLVGLLATVSQSQALPISPWGVDACRAGLPGAYVPYDGAPFAHQYNYLEGLISPWGTYGRNSWYIEQLDRQERFEKFGTRYGPDHPPLLNRLLERWRR